MLAAEEVRASAPGALGELEQAVQRSAEAVRRFALFARTSQPSREPVELLSTLRSLAEERGTGLRVAEGVRRIVLRLDADLPRAALVELVDNASEAMAGLPGRPLLTLDIEESETGPVACVGVEDTGPGMPLEARERFLEPFFTTRDEPTRAGLGAALAWGAVRALDGSLRRGDRAGAGTRVEIRLPVAP